MDAARHVSTLLLVSNVGVRTSSESEEGDEGDGVSTQSPAERAGCWVVDVCHVAALFWAIASQVRARFWLRPMA